MSVIESLMDDLFERMQAEQAVFTEELMKLSKEDILDHALEYAIRERILLCIEIKDLTERQAQALLTLKHPLADIYNRLDIDNAPGAIEMINNAIEHEANRRLRKLFLDKQKRSEM